MAHEFIHVGGRTFDMGSVTHAEFDGLGGARVFVVSGAVIEVLGEDADTVARAFGRHDAKHLTAKEAKAEAKAEAADIKTHK